MACWAGLFSPMFRHTAITRTQGNLANCCRAVGLVCEYKVNKHSNLNLAIDYGIGIGGSRGVFVNLGEVF